MNDQDEHPFLEEPLDSDATRSLLDQLIEDSRLYRSSEEYLELLDFVCRLRNFAPFNALLLQIQKPGLLYAASSADWLGRFNRWPKRDARPLVILWPFGPVAFVYDAQDTDGDPLPEDVDAFFTKGPVTKEQIPGFLDKLEKKRIHPETFDGGDGKAGSIQRSPSPPDDEEGKLHYRLRLNRNHAAPVQFATIAHELAHLFLGHLGPDKDLNVPDRPRPKHRQLELEAETVSYLVCKRSGVESRSQSYLSNFVNPNTTIKQVDLYQIMRAAGQVETILGLTSHTKF